MCGEFVNVCLIWMIINEEFIYFPGNKFCGFWFLENNINNVFALKIPDFAKKRFCAVIVLVLPENKVCLEVGAEAQGDEVAVI